MEDLIFLLIPLTFFVGFFALIFWIIGWTYRKTGEHWKKLANHFDLNLDLPETKWQWVMGNFPTASGKVKEYSIYIDMYTRGSGKQKTTYTRFSINLNKAVNNYIKLSREGLFSKIGKAFGAQDIEIGHKDFDDRFIIKTDNESFAKRVLSGRVRSLILRNLRFSGFLEIKDNMMVYSEIMTLNSQRNLEELQETIDVAVQIAKEIEW